MLEMTFHPETGLLSSAAIDPMGGSEWMFAIQWLECTRSSPLAPWTTGASFPQPSDERAIGRPPTVRCVGSSRGGVPASFGPEPGNRALFIEYVLETNCARKESPRGSSFCPKWASRRTPRPPHRAVSRTGAETAVNPEKPNGLGRHPHYQARCLVLCQP